MQPDPTIAESFGNGLSFLGEVLFKWIPGMITTVVGTVDPSVGTTTLPFGQLARPISAAEFAELFERTSAPGVYDGLAQGWHTFVLISLAVSIPFLAISAYCAIRIFFLRQHERAMFRSVQKPIASKDIPRTQLRWSRILEQSRTDAEHDWRLAILEADILLNELLDMQGYKGETIADKMKQADRANFNSIDAAWEAHKVRNRIAHDGSAHTLTSREARRVIGLYAQVFKEFGYIQ